MGELKDTNIGKVNKREIVDELKESYINYAMSVIVARALPDVRDGLKPVHRRILFAMMEEGLRHNSKFRKSATVVGSVLGRYHPHGDTAVYDSLVRMAQDFNLRYPLIQGQGNFGCFTKDTKVRLTDGRDLSFGELIEEEKQGKNNFTYTIDRNGRVKVAKIKNPRKTIENTEIMRIVLDNGEEIKCTLNHKFMLKDGSYKEAQYLEAGDSLMPLYFKLSEKESDVKVKSLTNPTTVSFVRLLGVVLNLPYTFIGLLVALISLPHKIEFNKNPLAIVLKVKNLWWGVGYLKSIRATAMGSVILLSDKAEHKDLEHELIHIDKYQKEPLIHPILYSIELLKNGYENNRYEVEAYQKAGNNYYDNGGNALLFTTDKNHKVIRKEFLNEFEDVYDLTIDKTHNFALACGIFVHNSIDGDTASAMRYSEAKLSAIGEEMLKDIDKDTVNFTDNYDGTRQEPIVLPSPLPQLLLNGTLGIAVGMATNIPPHNLTELIDATIYLLDNQKADTPDLFQFIQGPDFPTGGIIYDQKEIISAYSQGKGSIIMRGKADVVEKKDGSEQIIITELPYQVLKSSLVEEMANLVSEKKVEGIRDIKDLSDREGMNIVIDVKKGFEPQRILNRLYKFTNLQKTFHLNLLALVDGIQPEILSILDVLKYFVAHRTEVITRRTKFDLEKAKERNHILEGLTIALKNIDAVITLIKKSKDREEAKNNLIKKFKLTEKQAVAILQMQLQTLAGLERKKIEDELKAILETIKELNLVLKNPEKLKGIIKKELQELKEKFGDKRRTKIVKQKLGEISEIDLVPLEDTVVTLTTGGYIKRINPDTYKIQKRGGKGIMGMKTMQDDIVEHFLCASTHDNLLFFTDSGKVFQTQVYEIPEGTRVARGRGLLNFLDLSSSEKVLSLIPMPKLQPNEERREKYLVMATKNGKIKKTTLEEFTNVRKSGIIAIKLDSGDLLKRVVKTSGQDDITLVTKNGISIRFEEKDVRPMGRATSGVRGIRLKKGDEIIGMDIIQNQISNIKNQKEKMKQYLLVVMENGYGKRTEISQYKTQSRGGSGIKTANITSKTGKIVISSILKDSVEDEDLIVISQKGQVIRTVTRSISVLGRATQGVRIMKLDSGDKVASGTCL